MQFLNVFPDLIKIASYCWKNDDVNKIQRIFHVVYIFFESSLGKVELCQVSSF